MKRVLSLTLCLMLVFVTAISASALESTSALDQILSENQQEILSDRIREMESQYDIDIVLLVVQEYSGSSAHAYASDRWNSMRNSSEHPDDCIFLLISLADRDWAVITRGKGHDAVSNRDIDTIMDDVLVSLGEDLYYNGFFAFLDGIENQLHDYQTEDSPPVQISWPLSLIVGFVIALITVLVMRSGMKTAKPQYSATSYLDSDSFQLYHSRDIYLYSTLQKVKKPENNSSGSRGSGHGGRSGKF